MSSESRVEVVEIGNIEKHPNADSLSITQIHGGYPVIIRTDEYGTGGRAVYIPVDSIVPTTDERFAFLGKNARIKAKKIRGVFSMGMLTPAEPHWEVGQDVGDLLGITKWVPPAEREGGAPGSNPRGPDPDAEQWASDGMPSPPVYDIEGIRRYKNVLQDGEEVCVTEKIHGANARFVHDGTRLWVGSRTTWKKDGSNNIWRRCAAELNLEEWLRRFPQFVFYGEVYGWVQDLRYGATPGQISLRLFDVFNLSTGRYLDYDQFLVTAEQVHLPVVPLLYRGPWDFEAAQVRSVGTSTIYPGHCREGVVIKPTKERWDMRLGRVILKLVGEDYLLRKEAA